MDVVKCSWTDLTDHVPVFAHLLINSSAEQERPKHHSSTQKRRRSTLSTSKEQPKESVDAQVLAEPSTSQSGVVAYAHEPADPIKVVALANRVGNAMDQFLAHAEFCLKLDNQPQAAEYVGSELIAWTKNSLEPE